ncbi:MAG TPA: FtsX-like permease family protein [Pseudolysinimonas sp.]|nr:FtsX-like permease family protein [Pseudolysinimonas sp.]
MLAGKRMRRRAAVFVALFGVVALLAGLSVGLSGYIGATSAAGARAGVSSLEGIEGGFRVIMPVAADAAAQDAAVRSDIRAAVQVGGRPVPMSVSRDVVSANAVAFARQAGGPVRSSAASIPDLVSHARLIEGSWPRTAGEASMQADAAASLEVNVGDVLSLPGGRAITITALWKVSSAADPRWLEDQVALSGVDLDSTRGWIVIDPSLWKQSQQQALARWTIRPVADRIQVDQLDALRHAPAAVSKAVQKDDPGADVQTEGLLQLGIEPIETDLQAAGAVSVAPLIVVALLGLMTLIELAGMLGQLRSGETTLLRARGTSTRRFVVESVVEGVVTAVPAAVGGAALALWLLTRDGSADVPALGWAGAGAAVIVPVMLLAVTAARSTRDRLLGSRGRSGRPLLRGGARLTSTLTVGPLLLILLLAVVSVSQFLLYGSPLAPVARGGIAVDPLAVSAPALAIAAIGLLGIAAFPPVARGLERWARRARDLDALALLQLARRSRSALTPILVLAFAVSGLLLGVCYSGTWSVSARDTRQVQVGTSVRVTSSPPLPASITRAVPGQTSAAPVAREDAEIGQDLVSVIGIPYSRIAATVTRVGNAVDPTTLARRVTMHGDRPQIPAAATGVVLSFPGAPQADWPTGGSLIAVDAVGSETDVNLLPGGDGLIGALPAGAAPWTVHGFNLLLPDLPAGAKLPLDLRATGGSSATIPLDASWAPVSSADPSIKAAAGALSGRAGLSTVGATPAGYLLVQSVQPGSGPLPVVISRTLAESSGLSVGSEAPMQLVTRGGSVPVRVVGIAPVIPGIQSGEGILADLADLQDAASREGLLPISSGEWWIATTSPASVAAAEQKAHPEAGVVVAAATADEQVLESARVVVWIAGVATALLALLAIASGLVAELRSREAEVLVLRALGVPPRRQTRQRALEWSVLLGIGILVGMIDGVAVCALLVPALARTAIPHAIDQLRTVLSVDVPGLLGALAGLAATVVVLLSIVIRTVRVQAGRSPSAHGDSTSGAGR